MPDAQSSNRPWFTKWAWLLPSTAVGLYTGRVLSELLFPGSAGAVLLTVLAIVILTVLLRRYSVGLTWPLLTLLIYVFYPDPDPRVAAAAALLSGVTLALVMFSRRDIEFQTSPSFRQIGRFHAVVFVLLGLGGFALYLATLAPDVLPADNGEFQLVAAELGVAHPPGFPLYTILAHLMTRLPFAASAAYKVNLLSAIIGTLTLLLVFASVRETTGSSAAGLVASLALGSSTTYWAQSTTANIRVLTALFAALSIFALLRIRTLLVTAPREAPDDTLRPAGGPGLANPLTLAVLFILSLSLGVTHHASLAFMGLVMVVCFVLIFPAARHSQKRWLGWLLVALLGLLPLIYLPLRGAAGARGAPAGLATWNGFLDHVLARGFSGDFFYFVSPVELLRRLVVMGNVMTFQFSPVLLLGMALGLALLIGRDRILGLLLGGSFAIHTLIAATYRAPQTVEYMLPAYVVAAVCLGYGVGWLLEQRNRPTDGQPSGALAQGATTLAAAVLTVATVIQLFGNWPSFAVLHRDTTARDYAQPILQQAPSGSVILADWHWVTPIWYLQYVEGQRPDISTHFVFPTAEPYAQSWARRIQEELEAGRPVVATHFEETAYAELPIPLPIGEAFLFGAEPMTSLPPDYSPIDATLGGAIHLTGVQLEEREVELGREIVLNVAWEPVTRLELETTLFAHLVGPDQVLWAQQDLPARPLPDGLTVTQFRLTPRPGAGPGDYTIMMGAYSDEPFQDEHGQSRTPISTVQLLYASSPSYTENPTCRPLAGDSTETTLVGYDWDETVAGQPRLYLHWQTADGFVTEVQDPDSPVYALPPTVGPWGFVRSTPTVEDGAGSSHYVPFGQGIVWQGRPIDDQPPLSPGQMVAVKLTFASSWPVMRDLVSSVRLIGYEDDGIHWDWWDLDDGIPAMGAIPTLKWVAGSRVRDPHWLTVSEGAWAGQTVEPVLRLYDAFTNRPLPILDERLSQVAPWVPLGQTSIVN